MKKFIKQLLLFSALIFVPVAMAFVYLNASSKNKIENYKFSTNINKIIIGDSHTRLAINDEFLSNTINISQNSEGFIYSYYKLKALIKSNPQIDTIFLGAGYHTFAGYYDDHVLLPDISSRYFFILPTAIQTDLLENTKNSGLLVLKSFLAGLSNTFSKKKYSFIGEYENYSTKVSISEKSIKDRIKQAYFIKDKLSGFSSSNINYFHEIIQLCKDNKIAVIILNTPMYNDYKEQVPVEFKNNYYSLMKSENIKLFEFDGLQLGDTDFLPDGDHLSESGASAASKFLRDSLVTIK